MCLMGLLGFALGGDDKYKYFWVIVLYVGSGAKNWMKRLVYDGE